MLVWLGENINMEEKIVQIINKMADYLNVSQNEKATGSFVANIFGK